MRKLIFIALLVCLVGFSAIYYYATLRDENSSVQKAIQVVKKMVNNSTVLQKQRDTSVSNGIPGVPQTALEKKSQGPYVSLENLTFEELKKWVATESRAIDSVNNKSEEILVLLKAQAQTLGLKQLEILKILATDSRLAITDRIFSAYLLSLNSTNQSQQALYDVAISEIPNTGSLSPHSEDELKHTQELAIRYMQIDELFLRAKTEANAFDKLKLLVQTAASERVRSYAQKKILELK